MRLSRYLYFLVFAGLALGLSGCQQLFTTSLGKPFARASIPVPSNLSTEQAASLAAQAKSNQDPALAGSLLTGLLTQIDATTDPTTKAALSSSAASAAIVASGVGTALTGLLQAGTISTDPATLTNLLTSIQAGATPNNVEALTLLSDPAVLASPSSAGISATDLAIAAVVVASTVIPPGTDPAALNTATLTSAQITTLTTAQTILTSAIALAATDPSAQSLLTQIGGTFSVPSIP